MSHYARIAVEFKDAVCLVEALKAAGVEASKIEVHDKPVYLNDYRGKATKLQAHVVIRQKSIGFSNDLGFLCGEKPELHVCDMATNQGYGPAWQAKVKQEYTVVKTTKHYAKQGRHVHRVNEAEQVHLFVGV